MKKFVSIILILSLLLSLASCSKIKSMIGGEVSKTFSYPVNKLPVSVDPQIVSNESELIIVENCMEGLVRVASDGSIVPGVAESWRMSADGKQYTFNLRNDAKWFLSDENKEVAGEDFDSSITAEDFVFAIKRAVTASTASPDFHSVSVIKNASAINSGTADISSLGVKASGKYTLQISLESKFDGFLQSLSNAVFMPCNSKFFNLCSGRYGKSPKYFMSNGGFALKAWTDANIVMNNNEEYVGSNPAKGESVTLYYDDNAFADFQAGNYDAVAITYDEINYVLGDETLKTQSYSDTVWTLAVNCSSDFGKYSEFRKALMMSFENANLKAPDWAKESVGLIPEICTVGSVEYRKTAGNVKQIAYNPDKGRQIYIDLLERLEQTDDLEKLDSKITFCCTKEFDTTAKLIIQSWQKNLGNSFDAKISVLSLSELESTVNSGKYDIAILPVSAESVSALSFIKNYSANGNVLGFKSDKFESILSSGNDEFSNVKKAEQYLVNSAVAVPLFNSDSYYALRKNVSGIYFYAFGGKVNFINAVREK